jgi:ATP-dependent protease ClpP protease subunit
MTDAAPPIPVFATFVGEVNQASVKSLTAQLCIATQQQSPSVHLLMQSSGGTVTEGVYLYHFLKTYPTPITIYNVGSVQSAAVLAFLGAPNRVGGRHGSFMIHRPYAPTQGADLALLASAVASLQVDDARMDQILREHLRLPAEQWAAYERHNHWLDAQTALSAGLTTEIGEFGPPAGTPIYAFGMIQ